MKSYHVSAWELQMIVNHHCVLTVELSPLDKQQVLLTAGASLSAYTQLF